MKIEKSICIECQVCEESFIIDIPDADVINELLELLEKAVKELNWFPEKNPIVIRYHELMSAIDKRK